MVELGVDAELFLI